MEKNPIYILSIYNGHNATAALLRDGEIIACASEERFTGVKNSLGFPKKSIAWCLSYAGIKGEDLNKVALPFTIEVPIYVEDGKSKSYSVNLLSFLYKFVKIFRTGWGKLVNRMPYFRPFGWYVYMIFAKIIGFYSTYKQKQFISNYLNIPIGRIVAFDHHLSHCASAYYSSYFSKEKALVFSLDGEGDGLSATVNIFHNNNFKRISFTTRENSIGQIYSFVTRFLGMKTGEHEYKVMGLAPYAKDDDVLNLYKKVKDIIILDNKDKLKFLSQFNTQDTLLFLKKSMTCVRFDNVAAVFQKLTEDKITEWVSYAIKKTGISTVVCSGGVFMNVKANQKVVFLPKLKKAYFMPSAGDESTAIGACYLGYRDIQKAKNKDAIFKPLKNLYLGPCFSDEEIENIFKKGNFYKKYRIKKILEIEKHIAELLVKGQVVGRMSGRMEFGARALGNRSILANPSNIEIIKVINHQIKNRDFWMPFAPTILNKNIKKYCINPKNIDSPYMMMSFDSTSLAREHLKAALHPSDFTLRPQILQKESNPSYYKLIEEFERLTGIGGVLNTSFNLHGYPIVLGPKEALFVLKHSDLKYVAIEHFLLEKL